MPCTGWAVPHSTFAHAVSYARDALLPWSFSSEHLLMLKTQLGLTSVSFSEP